MTPYFEQGGIRIFHASLEAVAREVDLTDVGCVLADPTYGSTSLTWDKWVTYWPGKLVDAIPENAPMWCHGTLRMFLDHAVDFCDWKLSQDVVWEKHNGSGFQVDRFRNVHELVALYYRGDWGGVFVNPQKTTGNEIRGAIGKRQQPKHTGAIGDKGYTYTDERLMTSVLRVPSVHGDHDVFNETQKPVGLIEPLVRYALAPGKTLFEPFLGAGTGMVVAKSIGAPGIGCDIREDQCEATAKRLTQTMRLG